MSREIDWSELKEGDIFEVPNAKIGWTETLGLYHPPQTLLTIENGRVYKVNNLRNAMTFHTTHPSCHTPKVKQIVRVLEPEEVSPERYIETTVTRVNHCTGSDPEIFVVRGKVNKSLLPAFKYLPTQESQKTTKGNAVRNIGRISNAMTAYAYRDGFAAEFYTHPVHCHGYLINYLRDGLQDVVNAARLFDRTAELSIKNTFTIPEVTMEGAEEADIAFGCSPSLNAYGDITELPKDARKFRMRFAGGHVHFGIEKLADEEAAEMVRACDVVAAIPAVAMFASLDTPARRQYYGRAGEYRKPKYGLEYRVLSNAWLCAPEISHLTLNLIRGGLKIGKAGYRKYLAIDEQEARDIVNFCDVKAARKYVLNHLPVFYSILAAEGISRNPNTEKAFKTVVAEGVEAVLPDYTKVEKNWLLDMSWNGESNDHRATWSNLCRQSLIK